METPASALPRPWPNATARSPRLLGLTALPDPPLRPSDPPPTAPPPLTETFSGSASVLRRALPRVNVDRLLQEDPPLAFLDVRFALRELTELWGEEEMATIDEEELALALRSISLRPKRTHEYRLEFDATPLAKDSAAAGANGSSGGRRDGGRSGEDGGGRAGSEAPPAEEGKEAQEQKPSK